MPPIKDWKGNEIKAGMVIYFINTSPGILESSRHGLFMPDGKQIWEPEKQWLERKNKKVWELSSPYEVAEDENGILTCIREVKIDDETFSISQYFPADSIIAIKGISDQKLEL